MKKMVRKSDLMRFCDKDSFGSFTLKQPVIYNNEIWACDGSSAFICKKSMARFKCEETNAFDGISIPCDNNRTAYMISDIIQKCYIVKGQLCCSKDNLEKIGFIEIGGVKFSASYMLEKALILKSMGYSSIEHTGVYKDSINTFRLDHGSRFIISPCQGWDNIKVSQIFGCFNVVIEKL